jgi:hypothetical protein
VVYECADLFRRYGIRKIFGDQYAVAWVQEPFRQQGIEYKPSDPKSSLYTAFLPLLNSRKIRLLGNRRMYNQLLGLERTTARGAGRDTIDHVRGGYDDCANAVAGALVYATAKRPVAWVGTYCPSGRSAKIDYSPRLNPHLREPTRIRYVVLTEQEDLKRRGLL